MSGSGGESRQRGAAAEAAGGGRGSPDGHQRRRAERYQEAPGQQAGGAWTSSQGTDVSSRSSEGPGGHLALTTLSMEQQ